jgi:uncharacterized SAM-binding protein YcdF (DUF218 family)
VSRRALGAAVFVCALALAMGGAGRWLVVSVPIDRPDAIVSLASHEWERLPAAAQQAQRFPDAVVVLTLPEIVNPYNCHDCANRGHRLELAGVVPSRVRVVPLTDPGTHGEAVAVRRLVETAGLHRVLVVTSPYHTRRSLAVFRDALDPLGVTVGIVPAISAPPAMPAWWWTAPVDRGYVLYELAAVIYYAGKYGVWPT